MNIKIISDINPKEVEKIALFDFNEWGDDILFTKNHIRQRIELGDKYIIGLIENDFS